MLRFISVFRNAIDSIPQLWRYIGKGIMLLYKTTYGAEQHLIRSKLTTFVHGSFRKQTQLAYRLCTPTGPDDSYDLRKAEYPPICLEHTYPKSLVLKKYHTMRGIFSRW